MISQTALCEAAAAAVRRVSMNPTRLEVAVRETVGANRLIGIADFMHVNPSCPDRELSGLLRLNAVNNTLLDVTQGQSLLCVAFDHPSPRSEASREGGGSGFYFGLAKHPVHILTEPDRPYWLQTLTPAHSFKYVTEATERLLRQAPHADKELMRQLLTRACDYWTTLSNNLGSSTSNASDAICALKCLTYLRWIPDMPSLVRASALHNAVASAITEILHAGIDLCTLPLHHEQGQVCEYFGATQEADGRFCVVDGLIVREQGVSSNIARCTAEWDDVINVLREGRAVPCVELYLLALLVAPSWCHFGNTYGLLETINEWWIAQCPTASGAIRIGRDNENSLPVFAVDCVSRGGRRRRSLLTLDTLLWSDDEIAEVTRTVAVSGKSGPTATIYDLAKNVVR